MDVSKNQGCEAHLYKYCILHKLVVHFKLYGIKQLETAETIIQSLVAKVRLTKKAHSMGHINSHNYPAMQNGKKALD